MVNEKFPIMEGVPVVLKPIGNNARRWDGKPIRGTVSKIGRKYFYVKLEAGLWQDERFDKNTFDHDGSDCNGGYILYQDEKKFDQDQERGKMLHAVRSYFGNWSAKKPSYESIKKIFTILSDDGLI